MVRINKVFLFFFLSLIITLYLKKNKEDQLFNSNRIVFFLFMPYGHKHLYLCVELEYFDLLTIIIKERISDTL
jgi:hypothetical protein